MPHNGTWRKVSFHRVKLFNALTVPLFVTIFWFELLLQHNEIADGVYVLGFFHPCSFRSARINYYCATRCWCFAKWLRCANSQCTNWCLCWSFVFSVVVEKHITTRPSLCSVFIHQIFPGFKTRLLIYFMVQQLCIPCAQQSKLIYIGLVLLNSRQKITVQQQISATRPSNATKINACTRTMEFKEELHSLTHTVSFIFGVVAANSVWMIWMCIV